MGRQVKTDGSVTVVVPVYNREAYIKDCVQSIQNQTYAHLKIIVVDDGSSDNTVALVEELQRQDDRIKLRQHETNTGSMNKALHDSILECDTEFFTWIGSDDTYIPEAVEVFVGHHRQNTSVDYVSSNLKMTREGHPFCIYCQNVWPKLEGFSSINPIVQHNAKSYATVVYKFLCPPFPWNGMWKMRFFIREDITWIEYKGNTWSPDTLNGLYFFSKGMTMAHCNQSPLIVYRLHEKQDTCTGMISEQIRCDSILIEAVHEWFSPEVFLDKSVDEKGKNEEYISRLKTLIEHHQSRHPSSEKLKSALSDVATKALIFMWEKKIGYDSFSEEKTFFTSLV